MSKASATTSSTTTKTRTVPTGTMTALAAAMPEVVSGTSYFDPIDLLKDKMGDAPTLYAEVMKSMIWRIDTACLNQSATVLFEKFKDINSEEVVTFNEYLLHVAEYVAHDEWYEIDSNERTLAILLNIRKQWYDACQSALAADDKDFKPNSLRVQLESQKAKMTDVGTRANYKIMAEADAHGDAAEAELLYKSYLELDEVDAKNKVERAKPLIASKLVILHAAQAHSQDSFRFDHLPMNVQRSLTKFPLGAIDRVRKDLARFMSGQPFAFGRACSCAVKAKNALEKIIIKKYSDEGELENITSQVQIDMDRQAKRVAICSID